MSKVLKERREELGKDLNGIALVTRIKSAYLRAIEEEEYEKLPVEVYTRGYIREYAEFLGVPAGQALEPYEYYLKEKGVRKERDPFVDKSLASRLAKEQSEAEAAQERQQILDEVLAGKESAAESGRPSDVRRVLWIVLPVILGIGLYIYYSQESSAPPPPPPQLEQPEPQPPAQEPPVMTAPSDQETTPQEQTPEQTPGAPAGTPPPAAPSPAQQPAQKPAPVVPAPGGAQGALEKGVPPKTAAPAPEEKSAAQKEKAAQKKRQQTLDIVAAEQTWVEVSVDGAEKKEVLLRPGDKVSYTANDSIALVIGNAAGVKLNYNGKTIENLGAPGEVVRLNLSRPAPAPKPEPKPEPKKKEPAPLPAPPNIPQQHPAP